DHRLGVARSHECREGATRTRQTNPKPRSFRERVLARWAARTCSARKARPRWRSLLRLRRLRAPRAEWRQRVTPDRRRLLTLGGSDTRPQAPLTTARR